MTLDETRQLGIEFERRIQTMIPETETISKLDTETIYSYLNQYQDKFIHDIYRAVDKVPTSNSQIYLENILQPFMQSADLQMSNAQNKNGWYSISLPTQFGLYIDSYSNVASSYRFKGANGYGNILNTWSTANDANKAIQKPYDSMKILRSPIVWLTENNSLGAIYDTHTKPNYIHINYYRLPKYMNLMESIPCELPMEVFEDIVSGAVDLYVQYVAGAEARKKQLAQQAKQNKKKEDEE